VPAPQITATGSALWYLNRGTGVVALILLTLVVLLGILGTTRVPVPGLQRFVVAGLHRNLSLVTLGLLAAHITAAVLDPYAPIRLVDAFLPFASSYRPLWLGLGAVALDLLLAIVVTSLLRTRIGLSRWRTIHWATYAAWPVALLHGMGTGTDAGRTWMLALTFACVAAVVIAALYRIGQASTTPLRQLGTHALVIASPLAFGAWLVIGPLAPHWAARAGTPTQLLASSRAAAAAAAAGSGQTTAPASTAVPKGSGVISGGVRVGGGGGDDGGGSEVTVVLDGQLSSGLAGRLRIVLRGQALASGGVALSTGSVTLSGAGAQIYSGQVTTLNGNQIGATLSGPSGAIQMTTNVSIDSSGRAFTGQVSLT
jgi:sulfoxide reductase heme-binding subunit YedZ